MSGTGTELRTVAITRMYGPAVLKCMVWPCDARDFVDPGLLTVACIECIRPLIGACAPGHMDSARLRSYYRSKPRAGCLGHQCSHAPERPITPSSSHPLADLGGQILFIRLRHDNLLASCRSFVRACCCPLFVPAGRSFVPALRLHRRAAARRSSRSGHFALT